LNRTAKLLTMLALAAMPAAGHAQRIIAPNLSVGVKGGITESMMSFSPTVQQTFTQGYAFGVMARYTEENNFGVIAEVNFTQRGWAESFPDGSTLSYNRRFSFVQVPLLTHIYFGSRKFKGFFNLGPEFGYMIGESTSANFDYTNTGSVADFPSNRRTSQLAMEVSRKFDYGIAVGAGMEWHVNRQNSVMLEARFYYGLANVFPSSRGDIFGASRTMSLEVTAGYFFRII
jgi:hypothetical protein